MNKHLFVIFFMTVHGSVWAPVSDGSEVVGSASPVEQRRVMLPAGCLAQEDYWVAAGQQHAQQQFGQERAVHDALPVQDMDALVAQLAALQSAQ